LSNTGPESGQSKLSLADEAAFRLMCDDELASRRLYMLNNGYVPLPAEDKGVYLPNWSNLDADGTQCGIQPTIEDIDSWSKEHPEWSSTSVRCGEVIAIDCDVFDKAVAEKIRDEARRCFGTTFPTRVGSPPKFLLMCRQAVYRKVRSAGRRRVAGGSPMQRPAVHCIRHSSQDW